jgi:glycosyltransferase involved in cell wall biosynthesis
MPKRIKVLYLFNNVGKGKTVEKVKTGEESDDHLHGLLRMARYGIEADLIEVEKTYPYWFTSIIRRVLNVYFIHLALLWKFFKYDIVFSSTAYGTQLFFALLGRPKWVMYDFSVIGLIGEGRTFKQKIFKWVVGRSAGIITLSKAEEEKLKIMFPKLAGKIKFIPFGSDLNFWKPENVSEADQIFMPGLAPERDYKTLFDAVSGSEIKLVISQSRNVDLMPSLPANVKTKFFSVTELKEEMARSKVVVVPLNIKNGINEASGCSTVVEAMTMGKAVIATRTPTLESYVKDGDNGVLVETGDAEGLGKAINDLLMNDEKRKRIGENARKFVEQYCDADITSREIAKLFQDISA